MTDRLTEDERTSILDDLRAGESVRGAAQRASRAPSTVSRVAASAGLEIERCQTKKATAARRDYDLSARLALLNKVFDQVETLLPTCLKPLEVQQLATALAIAIDKRRLEDGEATSRAEVSSSGVRDRLVSRLDELAARRRSAGAA